MDGIPSKDLQANVVTCCFQLQYIVLERWNIENVTWKALSQRSWILFKCRFQLMIFLTSLIYQ